jgi:hypothetical protein
VPSSLPPQSYYSQRSWLYRHRLWASWRPWTRDCKSNPLMIHGNPFVEVIQLHHPVAADARCWSSWWWPLELGWRVHDWSKWDVSTPHILVYLFILENSCEKYALTHNQCHVFKLLFKSEETDQRNDTWHGIVGTSGKPRVCACAPDLICQTFLTASPLSALQAGFIQIAPAQLTAVFPLYIGGLPWSIQYSLVENRSFIPSKCSCFEPNRDQWGYWSRFIMKTL